MYYIIAILAIFAIIFLLSKTKESFEFNVDGRQCFLHCRRKYRYNWHYNMLVDRCTDRCHKGYRIL
jgi:hypothetical protein